MEFLKKEECDAYKVSSGKIYFGISDEDKSEGYLELEPNSSLEKHNRPVDEELFQEEGQSIIVLYEEESTKEVILNKGDSLIIPKDFFHIHKNNTSEISLTRWIFNGDIRGIVNNIKNSSQKVE